MKGQGSFDFSAGTVLVAGVDEVGRGPLAGPVVAAAVILDPERLIEGLDDSKKLTEARREVLADLVRDQALAWSLGRAEVEEIDRLNILQASLLAMRRAVLALDPGADHALVDGNQCPRLPCTSEPVVGGDGTVPAIGAASILAKVARDREMVEWEAEYPEYGFARHKGYGTREHLEALRQHGPTPLHRRSFAPVRELV